jgi:hypothetical protein
MSVYFKPVVWNEHGYRRPGGGKFTSGYPAEHGFGHEEWNSSSAFTYVRRGERYRVFHTEGLGRQDLDGDAGQIVVMMIASHQRGQYLAAMAAACIGLFGEEHRDERQALVRKLHLDRDRRDDEAWSLPSVRNAYGTRGRAGFSKDWKAELHHLPTWICPDNLYLALKEPILLDPPSLTGKGRLITMYGSYQQSSLSVALKILDQVPATEDQPTVARLRAMCGEPGTQQHFDVTAVRLGRGDVTTKASLIQARLGQGYFRTEVLAKWDERCAVTGCEILEIVRASHIKPWADSTNAERLDPYNGLPLCAHIDALFDRGLISFSDDGALLVSKEVQERLPKRIGLGKGLLEEPPQPTKEYLKYHRERVFLNGL